MVVQAVGELDLLEIGFERFPVGTVAVALVVGIDGFEELAYPEVVAAVLVP